MVKYNVKCLSVSYSNNTYVKKVFLSNKSGFRKACKKIALKVRGLVDISNLFNY